MAVTHDDLNQFQAFAKVAIAQSGDRLTLDDLWDQWRLEHPTQEEFEEDVLAVKEAIDDMERGDRGIPFDQHIDEMRKKHNLPSRK